MLFLISSATSRRRFPSAPLVQWAVVVWQTFSSAHGTTISKQGRRGWGEGSSSNITMVYLTCLFKKYTLSTILVITLPLHPLTVQSYGPATLGNGI